MLVAESRAMGSDGDFPLLIREGSELRIGCVMLEFEIGLRSVISLGDGYDNVC